MQDVFTIMKKRRHLCLRFSENLTYRLFRTVPVPVLFQETETADDGSFLGFAVANLEEENDADDKKDDRANAGKDPSYDRNDGDDDQKDLAHRNLQSLTDMEHGIGGFLGGQKSDDGA